MILELHDSCEEHFHRETTYRTEFLLLAIGIAAFVVIFFVI